MNAPEENVQLYLVTDEAACMGRDLYWVVEEAVQGGVTMVQLREKTLSTRAFIERAKRLKEVLQPYNVPLIINDRVDVALAADADGVHVGQSDMPYEILNQMLPASKIIGLSVESEADLMEAAQWDVSYLGLSPLYATPTKTDTKNPWGIEGLRRAVTQTKHSLIAIGGINFMNAEEVIRNGAGGIAVVSAICSATSPYEAAFRLKSIILNTKAGTPEQT
ncbi:thiamine phosphate synthase [Dyadobacter sp. Leaf189]|uniref:thiamine phosphate synthase n=1 Tax=Dyadobacter sp. Leaf189 TaxID=1736295 RepID=UPI0006F9BED3|nr:thiamine phosphate synthase [Dyadobacter sp. Leaf189]KQS33482.1 thiamine-phosphate pyrophosphorylase [Dyadobacter sp. Leaf189]